MKQLIFTFLIVTLIGCSKRPERSPGPPLAQDFEWIIIPDLQEMSLNALVPKKLGWDHGRSIFDWIVANKDSQNIQAVMQVGDITDKNTQMEWDTVNNWFNKLKPLGIPVIAAMGNHDYDEASIVQKGHRWSNEYNSYFGSARYDNDPYFKERWLPNKNENSLYTFSIYGKKYAAFLLEFLTRDSVLVWLDHKLDSLERVDPTREVIIVKHDHLTVHGNIATDTSNISKIRFGSPPGSNSADSVWYKVLQHYSNVKWIFGGHFIPKYPWALKGYTANLVTTGVKGNTVRHFLVNYQVDKDYGGGYFMRMKFKKNGEVDVSFYSDYYKIYDPHPTNASYTFKL